MYNIQRVSMYIYELCLQREGREREERRERKGGIGRRGKGEREREREIYTPVSVSQQLYKCMKQGGIDGNGCGFFIAGEKDKPLHHIPELLTGKASERRHLIG